MGDMNRFPFFAEFIARRFPSTLNIADVAGGKGYLKSELFRRGFKNVTSWDKCKAMRGKSIHKGFRNQLFDYSKAQKDYQLVIGMHPDEGTDHIIQYAINNKVPFCICPCCVKPSAIKYNGPSSYYSWINHLANQEEYAGMIVEEHALRIKGCSIVLIGKWK